MAMKPRRQRRDRAERTSSHLIRADLLIDVCQSLGIHLLTSGEFDLRADPPCRVRDHPELIYEVQRFARFVVMRLHARGMSTNLPVVGETPGLEELGDSSLD